MPLTRHRHANPVRSLARTTKHDRCRALHSLQGLQLCRHQRIDSFKSQQFWFLHRLPAIANLIAQLHGETVLLWVVAYLYRRGLDEARPERPHLVQEILRVSRRLPMIGNTLANCFGSPREKFELTAEHRG